MALKSGWKESPFMNSGFVNGMGVDPQTGDGLYVADVSKYNQGNIGTGDGNITQSQFDEYKKTVVTIDGKELTKFVYLC